MKPLPESHYVKMLVEASVALRRATRIWRAERAPRDEAQSSLSLVARADRSHALYQRRLAIAGIERCRARGEKPKVVERTLFDVT